MKHTCGYDKAWIGRCKTEVNHKDARCEDHTGIMCVSCGNPATRECDETGQFVCGAPLCDECIHNVHPLGHNGGIGFNALPFDEGMKVHCKKSEQKYAPWYINDESLPEWKKYNNIPDEQYIILTNNK